MKIKYKGDIEKLLKKYQAAKDEECDVIELVHESYVITLGMFLSIIVIVTHSDEEEDDVEFVLEIGESTMIIKVSSEKDFDKFVSFLV